MAAVTSLQEELSGVRVDIHQRRLKWAWVMDGCAIGVAFIAIPFGAPGLGILAMILAGLGVFSGGRVIVARGQTAWRRAGAAAAILLGLFGLYVAFGSYWYETHGLFG